MYSLSGNQEKVKLGIYFFYFKRKPVLVNFDTMEYTDFMKFVPDSL